jgi:hypothetical protein
MMHFNQLNRNSLPRLYTPEYRICCIRIKRLANALPQPDSITARVFRLLEAFPSLRTALKSHP